jgi:hypothetical protein
MARLVERFAVGVLAVVGLAYLLAPAEVSWLLSPGTTLIVDAIMWADANLPRPLFIAAIFLVTTVVSILVALSTARVIYMLLKHGGPRTKRAWNLLTPNTPVGKVGAGAMIAILVLLGSVWILPYAIGGLSADNPVERQADDTVNDTIARQELDVLSDDVVAPDPSGDELPFRRAGSDADGDRLPDSWERQERTPAGVSLPDADPQRMDLYVQVDYGGGTRPLSDAEKGSLESVFADMPVQNPDGSEGITLHIDDQQPGGGPIGENVVVGGDARSDPVRYYSRSVMGARRCVYHQVVFGTIERDGLAGYGHAPGFASVVAGDDYDYDGDPSARVHVITHHLIHNVVGEVDGEYHTESGWLAPTVSEADAMLPESVAAAIEADGLTGSGYYQRNYC